VLPPDGFGEFEHNNVNQGTTKSVYTRVVDKRLDDEISNGTAIDN
jgi:hypothetical protein